MFPVDVIEPIAIVLIVIVKIVLLDHVIYSMVYFYNIY